MNLFFFKQEQNSLLFGLALLGSFLALLSGMLVLTQLYHQKGTLSESRVLGSPSDRIAIPGLASPTPTPYNTNFSLQISQLGINAPVNLNIDGSRPGNYLPNVLKGIAHYRHKELPQVTIDGSLPGQGGNIFLFGHSQIPGGDMSNFQGVFNNLGKLEIGDIVQLTYQGKLYQYKVYDSTVVNKQAVSYLEKTPEETLTLMTCWPLGLDVKRLVVRAKPIL